MNNEYENAPWMLPLTERLAQMLYYMIVEWGMTREEADRLTDTFTRVVSLVAVRRKEG